jgi:xanthine dehydrogenase YagT iron-sulfur-binding subunit
MSAKPPRPPEDRKTKPKSRFSRRGFIQGLGVGGGVLSGGLLETVLPEAADAAPAPIGPDAVPVTLRLNGKPVQLSIEPRVTLLDALRNNLGMTGVKRVCDRASCGACTMIISGKVMYGCTVLAIDAQGKDIQTIEGLAPDGKFHPVSEAFVNNDAQQCGFCTPGFVMAVKGYLDRNPNPTMEDVEKGLGGNFCRCGTYAGIRPAVLEAAKKMKGGAHNA